MPKTLKERLDWLRKNSDVFQKEEQAAKETKEKINEQNLKNKYKNKG
jgi:hypothetical protein